VAAPSGSLILAELGADVIKVESPDGGDQARNMPTLFLAVNRNKKSIAIDLKSPSGRDIFLKLMEASDVVIDNYSPGVLDRLEIDYDVAREINPRIIYCAIKGFTDGPYDHRPFLDDLAQMEGGLAYMTGPPGQPLKAGASIVDIGAGTYGVLGVIAALYERERSGQGQHLKAGLFETVAFWVGQHMSYVGLTGEVPQPFPVLRKSNRGGWGVYQLFNTRDENQIFIAVTSNAHWERFCKEFDLLDLYEDESLDTNAKRVANRDRTIPRIQEAVGKFDMKTLSERLNLAQVPFAPVNTPADLLEDPHLNSGNHLLEIELPDKRKLKLPSLPVSSDRFSYSTRENPPRLGQHTREILADLGYNDKRVRQFIEDGIVAIPES
jgi:crotonobetainyl-CoA:carnitine CoA-transferase CaiB-like acyl-CoA transferase